ncbi:MAG: LuxR family transcriptional regulator, partial [bacterium]|nr:LuxR family transcriptional regulator [bacterium]
MRKVNENLIVEIAERKQTETELKKTTHDLGERMKELKCLYGISELFVSKDIDLNSILQGTVELIPPSWQYPEITCARIILHDQKYQTDNFKETLWKQSGDIFVKGERAGTVDIY